MDFSLEGVSEKTFNAVYFNDLTIGMSVPFNDDHQVNHFDKHKAHHIWSNSGEVVDAVTIHFSEDCYTLDENGKPKKDPETLSVIPLEAFTRLHPHDPSIVMKLTHMAYGTTKKYGRRPQNCTSLPILIRSVTTVPSGLKGHTHCTQRAFAALLHLKYNVPIDDLDSLFKLDPMMELGADTEPVLMNRSLRSEPVLTWLASHIPKRIAQLEKPVIGDFAVRELLRSLKDNEGAFTYPVDFRGVGRHCSLAYKPLDDGGVVIWDPSPSFDYENEVPKWNFYNEFCLGVRSYEQACLVLWISIPQKQSKGNLRRCLKRKLGEKPIAVVDM
jgi:hypothetical protein